MAGLRLLHAIHHFLPRHQAGSEIYALELCRALGDSRHHVTVLCADVHPSRPHGYVEWRDYKGVTVVEITNNWIGSSFEDTYRPPLVGNRIAHVMRAVQPDVVHVHNLLNLSFDLPAMARVRGVPVVATLHDYTMVCPSGGQRIHRAEHHVCHVIEADRCARCFGESPFGHLSAFGRLAAATSENGPLRRLVGGVLRYAPLPARRLLTAAASAASVTVTPDAINARLAAARRVFDDVDLFVAPSPSLAAEFKRLGIPDSKLLVSDYGFAHLERRPRPPTSLPLRIGYVGTLTWHKGVHVLLKAVQSLQVESYTVSIFGDLNVAPDYVAELRRLAHGLPVRFEGAFDRAGVGAAYARLDVLVVPSIWLENSPLVVHEAFLAGVPVVGARMGGIADLVEHERSGLLYEATSPDSLAAALRRLIDAPDMIDDMASRLPEVKSMRQDASAWQAVYQHLTARARASAG